MYVWRLTKKRYAQLDGEGVRLYGSRWNSIGRPVVYTASSLSLALLEQLVRIDPDEIPNDFVSVKIEIPDNTSMDTISLASFPKNWQRSDNPLWFREKGDNWLDKQETAILIVPSAIVPEEKNILINPLHPGMKKIKIVEITPFIFDERLF